MSEIDAPLKLLRPESLKICSKKDSTSSFSVINNTKLHFAGARYMTLYMQHVCTYMNISNLVAAR